MELSRRTFLAGPAAGLVALSARRASADANSTVVLALMGANNRGSQLATASHALPPVNPKINATNCVRRKFACCKSAASS